MSDIGFTRGKEELLLRTPIFSVIRREEIASDGFRGNYVALDTQNWVIAVTADGDDFILVRQWRHGMSAPSVEFAGGVSEPGESPVETALRELREETGFRAKKAELLGTLNPNPAMFSNRVSFVLCEELEAGESCPDGDERIELLRVPKREMISAFGTGEYVHALMAAALFFYTRKRPSLD